MDVDSYCRRLLRELDEQRLSGVLCDCRLVVEGQIFWAHRNVLCASSRYFKSLFSGSGSEDLSNGIAGEGGKPMTVELEIGTARGFVVLLDFVYSARLGLAGDNVIEVMSAASYLQMTEVVQVCLDFIRSALNITVRPGIHAAWDSQVSTVTDGLLHPSSSKPTCGDGDPSNSMTWSPTLDEHVGRRSTQMDGSACHLYGRRVKMEPDWYSEASRNVVPTEDQGDADADTGVTWATGDGGLPGRMHRNNRKNKMPIRHVNDIDGPEGNGEAYDPGNLCSTSTWTEDLPEEADCLNQNTTSGLEEGSIAGQIGEGVVVSGAQSVVSWPGGSLPLPPDGPEDVLLALGNGAPPMSASGQWTDGSPLPAWGDGRIGQDILSTDGDYAIMRKRFRCSYCSFAATHQCILKRHLRSHTGERPFSCETCGKKFTRREHMRRHAEVHSKEKFFSCKLCRQAFSSAESVGIQYGPRRYGVCSACTEREKAASFTATIGIGASGADGGDGNGDGAVENRECNVVKEEMI
uniref:zinc finger and BTB domain-containing protein 46-like isoform X1 n=1 Tax=Myxine glutinosa TaxID=7769 RepID=UPI00358E5392